MNDSHASLADYRWLVEGAGRHWLSEAQADPLPLPEMARRLRRDLTPAQTHLVLSQLELRARAVTRFPRSERMYFTDRSLQQATDERLADYKATRFPWSQRVVDLCCGAGGDLLALARRGPTLGIEQDEILAYLASANLQNEAVESDCDGSKGWVGRGDASEPSILPDVAVHLDPDRRPNERRSVCLDWHQPGREVIERLSRHPGGLGLKLAPATEVDDPLLAEAELEWIGHSRQCQQLVAWFGPLAKRPGQRVATLLETTGEDTSEVHQLAAAQVPPLPISTDVGRFVIEPTACVLAAGLAGVVAHQYGLNSITAGGGYLTGDQFMRDAWTTWFEVLDVLPFRLARLKSWLRQRSVGQLEIKQRSGGIVPEELRRQLNLQGNHQATLIVTRQGPRRIAIFTRRVTPPSPPDMPG